MSMNFESINIRNGIKYAKFNYISNNLHDLKSFEFC